MGRSKQDKLLREISSLRKEQERLQSLVTSSVRRIKQIEKERRKLQSQIDATKPIEFSVTDHAMAR